MAVRRIIVCLLTIFLTGCKSAVSSISDSRYVFVYGDIWNFTREIEVKAFDANGNQVYSDKYEFKNAYHAGWIDDDYYLLGGPAVRINSKNMKIEKVFDNTGAMEQVADSGDNHYLLNYGTIDLNKSSFCFVHTIYDADGNVIYSFDAAGTSSIAAADDQILICDYWPADDKESTLTIIDKEGNVLSKEINENMIEIFNTDNDVVAINKDRTGYYYPLTGKEYSRNDVSVDSVQVWGDRIIRTTWADETLWIDWIEGEQLKSEEIILPEHETITLAGTVRNNQLLVVYREDDGKSKCVLVDLMKRSTEALDIEIQETKQLQIIDAFVYQ